MIIREIRPPDAAAWETLRCELWPDGAEDHREEIAAFFAGTVAEPNAVLVAEDPSGSLIGVAELSIRDDVPGLAGKRTGYVEGLYIRPEWGGRGIARELLVASKEWARKSKCEAFASDRAGRVVVDKGYAND
jgi:aminoglycoside 6'-N-acetyltransferase I